MKNKVKSLEINLIMKITFLSLLVDLMVSDAAHAYLDPGSGSMLLQLLLGGVAGIAAVGKLYWEQIKGFFRNRLPQKNKTKDGP